MTAGDWSVVASCAMPLEIEFAVKLNMFAGELSESGVVKKKKKKTCSLSNS
jgi:hypothetical protein